MSSTSVATAASLSSSSLSSSLLSSCPSSSLLSLSSLTPAASSSVVATTTSCDVGRRGAQAGVQSQQDWVMGRVNIQRRWKKGKNSWHRTSVTHDFYVKNNPRQKSGDAAAWATFAPMWLHRQNQCGSMNTSCILAPSATIGGARSTCIFGRSARLRGFVFLLKQAGSVPKEKKNECDGKTTNLVVAKKKGGNRLTSIFL